MTFEEFKELFDGLSPDEYANKIRMFENYIEKVNSDFYNEYTYCTGCKKIVKRNEVYVEKGKSMTFNRSFIRCNKCNTIWYIRDDDDEFEEEF